MNSSVSKPATFESFGSLSKDDGNGNDDARKQCSDWLNQSKNNRAARAARTLIQFFDVVCQMTWNFQIKGFNDNVNTQQQIFHSLYFLQRRFYQSISRVLGQKQGMRGRSKINQIVSISQMFIFKWRFRCRCRRCCLSSLLCIAGRLTSTFHSWSAPTLGILPSPRRKR